MVVALASPLYIGIYESNHLIKTYEANEQTSEALPLLFENVLKEFTPRRLFFARGPGSFMATKIAYIFLRTMSIAFKIPLFACDGFAFNENRPIKALRNLYFVKENEAITTQHFLEPIEQKFVLPKDLDETLFDDDNEPLYMLPAV